MNNFNMKTGIVFSCFNIEHTLDVQKLIQVLSEQEHYYFCFVNDCSTDNTNQVLSSIKQKIPHRTFIINLEKKSGRPEALRTGIVYFEKLRYINYIGFFKNDLYFDFKALKSMTKSLHFSENTSIVFGLEEKSKYVHTKERNLPFEFFKKKCPFGKDISEFLKLKDSTMVFSKSIVPILFDSPFVSKHFFYLEILLRLKLLFGEKNLNKFILIKNLKLIQVQQNKPYLSFYQGMHSSFLLLRFCINYTLLRKSYLLLR